jgi:ribonuclease Y
VSLVLVVGASEEAGKVHDVLYVAVAVFGVLGLLFIAAYVRRGAGTSPVRSAVDAEDDASYVASARRVADAEAALMRQLAQTEAEALRRTAESEALALRRVAESEAATAKSAADFVMTRAEAQVAELLADARREAAAERLQLTDQAQRRERELAAEAERIDQLRRQTESQVLRWSADSEELAQARAEFAARQADHERAVAELAERDEALRSRQADHEHELERVAGLTADEAKAELMAAVETTTRRDAALLVRTLENEARAEGTERARAIVVEAVQRVASEQTTETVVSVLHLPGDEMKGRIIGREGRNIRAFESVTGVNVIIDDTPEAVLLSCFDPVRREVGRLTLEKLISDGRIHPHRIEEAFEMSKAEVDDLCLRAAREALIEVGVAGLDERLMPTLGRLKYRTSYGQNVLGHLIETAHVAGVMAAELGIEPTLVKRCAFLHDIGKALTHEVEGSHAIIGAELLRKHGESEAVAHAVEAHHNEVQPRTIEAVLTQASDTCSAARPGARRESLESYVKRLARIEEIATTRPGVEKVFAMQSGREVRVMVLPSEVDDLGAQVIAREIAKQIEDELTYPGQIRVTVVRESRATEVAH